MKARFFKKVSFGLALSALPFVAACNQTSNSSPLVTTAQAEPAVATTNAAKPAPELTVQPPPPSAEITPVPVPAPGDGKKLPPTIKPGSPVAEIVKLAQSGVDEAVMLTYISNSANIFGLSSDEIIYLNDIGVASNVVTAMIQHDQTLKQNWDAQNAVAQANAQAAQPAQAAAPTYVNPPQPEAQPAPVAVESAPPQQPVNVTYNYFYDSLSPYGTWIDVEGYGRCWQPTVVVANHSWRPYCDRGRWIYTDAGWYWNSDYSWGWATFHYGRWFSHPRWGWCWYPDYVWGPSWVSWRYSDAYCGWAPLPPAACYRPGFGFSYYDRAVGIGFDFGIGAAWFNFVPWARFCDSRPWHHRVHGSHVTQIYNNTTVINNVVVGNNNTIINNGVPIDRVRRHTGREIRQLAIRETTATAGHTSRGDRIERDGRTLLVTRPDLTQTTRDGRPSRLTQGPQRNNAPVATTVGTQIETPRGQGHVRQNAGGNDRVLRSQPLATTDRNEVQPAPTTTGNTRIAPSTSDNTPRNNNGRSSVQGGGRVASAPTTQPTQRNTTPTANTANTQRSPSGSLVVIGRQNSNPGNTRGNVNNNVAAPVRTDNPTRTTHNWSQTQPSPTRQPSVSVPQTQTPRVSAPQAPQSYTRATQPSVRQASPSPRTYSAPVESSPSPRMAAPTYSAPRSTPAPSPMPSYSAPHSAPSPSYSAPRSSQAAPQAYSAPRSSPPSSSGNSDSGRHGASSRR